jgi:hypothetical protein
MQTHAALAERWIPCILTLPDDPTGARANNDTAIDNYRIYRERSPLVLKAGVDRSTKHNSRPTLDGQNLRYGSVSEILPEIG